MAKKRAQSRCLQ